jgi:hypothetical protein
MNKLTFAKCSSILKDPYDNFSKSPFYILRNKISTFVNVKNFQSYFNDFREKRFPEEAKQIFDEVGYGLKHHNQELFTKNLNENIYFALRDEKSDFKTSSNDYLTQYFTRKNFDWKIVHARTNYLDDYELAQIYAQITMKYSTEENRKIKL